MKRCRLSFRHSTPGAESDLVESFIGGLERALPDRDYALFVEPKLPTGYPDCVLVEYDPKGFSSWACRRRALTDLELRVLFLLHPKMGLRVSSVAHKAGLPEQKVRKILQTLVDNGDAICVGKDRFCSMEVGMRGVRSVMTVEAKIRDFERVVDQAAVNGAFANESYVLMPNRALSSDNLETLRASRVGMFSVSPAGQIKRVRGSLRRCKASSYLSLYFNEWIGWRLRSEGGSRDE